YKSDTILIPKNTMVLVRRIPFTGTRMPRVTGGMPQQQPQQQQLSHQQGYGNRGGFHRNYNSNGPPPRSTEYGYRGPQGIGLNTNKAGDSDMGQEAAGMDDASGIADDAEDARIAAMLQQSTEQWSHQQSMMEMQRRSGAYRPRPFMVRPERQGPPPPNYVCHRCGTQGHWIDKCPTLSQAGDGSGRAAGHRIKRTTGIPRSFLQKVDNLDDVGNALVTSDGTLVVATANKAAWNHAQRLTGSGIGADDAVDPSHVPDDLKCYICRNLARDAVTTPCCKTVFCSSCIEAALLATGDMRFTCPDCNTKGVVPDQLETAGDVRGRVDEFLREYAVKQRSDSQDAKPSVGPDAEPAKDEAQAKPTTTSSVPVSRPPVQMQPRPRVPQQNMAMMHQHAMMMGMGPGFPVMGMPMGMPPYMPPGMVPPYPQLPGMVPGSGGAPWTGAPSTPQQQQQQQPQTDEVSPTPRSSSRSNGDSAGERRQGNGRSRSRYGDRESRQRSRDSHQESRASDDRDRHHRSSRQHRESNRNRGDERYGDDDRRRSRARDESRRRGDSRSENRSQSSATGGSSNRRHRDRGTRGRSRSPPPARADSKVVQLTIRGKSSDMSTSAVVGANKDSSPRHSVFDRIRDDRPDAAVATQGGTRDDDPTQQSSGGGRRRRRRNRR
ncbi:Retinoblastoma-binding protein, partial [Coemansia sp. RSA 1933]